MLRLSPTSNVVRSIRSYSQPVLFARSLHQDRYKPWIYALYKSISKIAAAGRYYLYLLIALCRLFRNLVLSSSGSLQLHPNQTTRKSTAGIFSSFGTSTKFMSDVLYSISVASLPTSFSFTPIGIHLNAGTLSTRELDFDCLPSAFRRSRRPIISTTCSETDLELWCWKQILAILLLYLIYRKVQPCNLLKALWGGWVSPPCLAKRLS